MDASRDICLKKWKPLAEYLSRRIYGCSFRIIPLKIGVIPYAIENGDVDFILCNPTFYAIFCQQRNVTQLATRINNDTGRPLSRYAGTIFCRTDNESIYCINDIKGRIFACPNAYSLGGWLSVWREMLKQDFNPQTDTKELKTFATQEEVVKAVLNGTAEAGSVRSDVLELMANSKQIHPEDFRIINRKMDDFALPHSTECYPEWGFVQLQHVPNGIAKQVTVALLQMTPRDYAAVAAEIAGWTSPENCQPVIECLEYLNLSPYIKTKTEGWLVVVDRYWPILLGGGIIILTSMIVAVLAIRANMKYRDLKHELSQRQDRMSEIFDCSDEGLAYCNNNDEIIYVNQTFCRLTGCTESELTGDNIFHRLPTDLCHSASRLIDEYRNNNYSNPHEMTYCINGIDVAMKIKPFYADEKYHGALFSLADINDLMTARREIAAINHELEDSIRRANRLAMRALQADQAKANAITNLNRDIRTPLNGIMGLANILENTELQPQQKNYIDILKNSIDTMVTLLDKALDMSRLEFEQISLDRVLFDVRDEISQILKLLRFQAAEKGLSLDFNVENDVPQKICNSPDRLRQILINLVSNSIHHTEKGKISLRVTSGRTVNDGCEIKFAVSDTGIGISPEKLETIFDKIPAGDNLLDVHGGTGLALAISSKIARLMGGSLVAESSPGIGSTFTLTIVDFHSSGTARETRTPDTSHSENEGVLEGLKVLIAEDNQVNRLVLDEILLKHGCTVTCVENGRAAVEEVVNDHFDLVLMDCHMPVLDGFEATLEIRRLAPPFRNIPILAITANALPQIKDYCFRCGMNGYISKPFSAETLKTAIIRCLSGAPAAANERAANTAQNEETIDVDQQALVERIGKSGDVMKHVVELFLDDCVKSIAQLHKCFDENDMTQAAMVSHSLKGSSALAGAARIQNAAMEAEQAALDANREYLGKVIEIIEECFKKYKTAVSACI
ncbi:MAG TPA: PhnD/SsuA/transferrin family substrate-binding protein [Phycisphaerae bacterium]|nr:PhnD/SsuA/transferrin family substrate-binding protein [Phycisphaerae bacterium]